MRRFPWPVLPPALGLACALALAPAGVRAQTPDQSPAAPAVSLPVTRGTIVSISGDEATLNVGANQGLAVGQELSVSRSGQIVGRVVLTQVNAETSVGRVSNADGFAVTTLDGVLLPDAPTVPPAVAPSPAPPVTATAPPAPVELPARTGAAEPSADMGSDRPSYNEHAGDIIPWERWEYVALSSLAADGLLPGYAAREFQSDRLFTRGQLASLTATGLGNIQQGPNLERNLALLRRLVDDFKFEPPVRALLGTETAAKLDLPRVTGSSAQISAYGGLRYYTGGGFKKAEIVGRIGGLYDVGSNAFVTVSVNDLHRRTSYAPHDFPAVDQLTLNFRALDVDWEIGKASWESGPVYSGDGLLSNNAPAPILVKARKTFSYGRFPGKFTLTQIYGGFHDYGGTKYYGLRRIESAIGKKLELGLAESYVATSAPNPLSLVLPYYAYQRLAIFRHGIGGHQTGALGNDTFNYMAQVDLLGHVNPNLDLYGEIILDDISAPSGLGQGNVPRKLGYVAGAHFPRLFGDKGEGRLEYYLSDRETYLGVDPKVRYSERNLFLGSPFGPNTRALFARLDYRFTQQFKGIVALQDAMQNHDGLPSVGDRFSLGVEAAYDVTPGESISLRVTPQRYKNLGSEQKPTTTELLATYAY